MQPATGEGLCYNLKRNDNGNIDVDGGPRGRSDWCRGNEEQGAVWTGGVRRVQSKCWPDTWERLDPIVFYRCGGTDKQKDLNKSYSKINIVRRWSGSGGRWGTKSPRTVDKVERYFQQTWIESTLGEDGGNVGGI